MDRRTKYTKHIIEDTFLGLLEKKDIGSITVTEICEIADINRATFYRYYVDIYDLLKNIQDNFIEEIKASNPMINLPNYTVYNYTYEKSPVSRLFKHVLKWSACSLYVYN